MKKEFFERDTLEVAKQLLGKIIYHNGVKAKIVEVEAYKDEPGSHAYKRTKRSETMFNEPGRMYVYLIYGMYHCLNIVTEKRGKPGAVLIRAIEPLSNIELIKKRRNCKDIKNLTNGPGKVCKALDITKKDNGKKIKILDNKEKFEIEKSNRIGLTQGKEFEWRFYIKNNRFVSK